METCFCFNRSADMSELAEDAMDSSAVSEEEVDASQQEKSSPSQSSNKMSGNDVIPQIHVGGKPAFHLHGLLQFVRR